MSTTDALNSTTSPISNPTKIFEPPWRRRAASWASPHEVYRVDTSQGTCAALVLRRGEKRKGKGGDVAATAPALEYIDARNATGV
jgi:hypothetical protein